MSSCTYLPRANFLECVIRSSSRMGGLVGWVPYSTVLKMPAEAEGVVVVALLLLLLPLAVVVGDDRKRADAWKDRWRGRSCGGMRDFMLGVRICG